SQPVAGAGKWHRQSPGLERAADLALGQRHLLDLAVTEERHELAHRNLDRARGDQPPLDHEEHGESDEEIKERELCLLPDGKLHRENSVMPFRVSPRKSV